MLKIPFNGDVIVTNPYRTDKFNPHYGTDYAMGHRTAIIAVADGIVIRANYLLPTDIPQAERQWIANSSSDPYKRVILGKMVYRALTTMDYGNFVKIDHGQGVSTLYAHLDELCVFEGQSVKEGQLIGYSDSTGNSTGNHLHFEIRVNDWVIDPAKFDYSFVGEAGVQVEVNAMNEIVNIVTDLYVRIGPNRNYRLGGCRELHKGDIVDVVGWVKGESIDGNDVWFKSVRGNYFWSGGTDKPGLPGDKEGNSMTKEELIAQKAKIEADLAALESAPVAEPVAEPVVAEPVVEAPVEAPKVEEVSSVVEEPKVEVPVEPVAEVVEPVVEATPAEPVEDLSALDKLFAEIKALFSKK